MTMNPHSRPAPSPRDPASPRRSGLGSLRGAADALEWEELPSLAHILAHYREHGTVARTVAAWHPTQPQTLPMAPVKAAATPGPLPFAEVIEGLQTRELDGGDLFEHFFGPNPR